MSSLNRSFWRARIPLLLAGVLAVSMAFHLSRVVAPEPAASPPVTAPATSARASADMLAQSLGHPLLPAAAQSGLAAVAPRPTALEARLRGVSTGLKVPMAIIDHAGRTWVVSEGDALGEVRIERILPDRVELAHEGRLETLSLRREAANSTSTVPPSTEAGANGPEARDEEMDRWMNELSEADPETAAWLRERMRELHDQPAND